jgi:hypothetical protein
LVMLGQVYARLKQMNKAIEMDKRALEIAKEIGFPEKIRQAAFYLSENYRKVNDYKSALENYELYILMRDSVRNQSTQKASIRTQFKIEFDRKEQLARSEQEKINIKNEEERQKQAIIRNSFIGGFVLVLILAIVIFRSFLQNKKKNALIEQQKQLVEEKQKEILDSIHYARKIQKALMPTDVYINNKMKHLK